MIESSTRAGLATDASRYTDEITGWLKQRFDESGASMFVLGVSGGIDSAVVCGLCSLAVGPGRVLGVIMPSSSNPDDAESAREVVGAFGVKNLTVDLTPVSDNLLSIVPDDQAIAETAVDPTDLGNRKRLAVANVRPRLRMTTLYYVANMVKGIVVGTGNKSEAMIGYYTKYGDGGVDLFPIIDLYKHQVRAVANHLGVPQSVIDRPPSAGLWQGQTDEDEIGLTYDELDATLAAVESGDTSGVDPESLKRVMDLRSMSEHKRQPLPIFRKSTASTN